MRKIAGMIVLAASLTVGIWLVWSDGHSGHFSEYMVDEEQFRDIMEKRVEEADLSCGIVFNEESLFQDSGEGIFYYSLIEGDTGAYDPAVKVKCEEEDVNIAFLTEGITEEGIRDNRSIPALVYTDGTYRRVYLKCTTLPLMNIECGEEIGDDSVAMKMKVFDNRQDAVRRVVFSEGEIHIRGGSTREFPKKAYRISLKQESPGNHVRADHVSLLGMRQDDDWLLYAAYNDQEKIRNVFSSNLWEYTCGRDNAQGINTGMEYRYMELFINNEYRGLYALGYPIDEKLLGLDGDGGKDVLYKKLTWASEETMRFSESGNIDGYEIKSGGAGKAGGLTGNWSFLLDYYSDLYESPEDNEMLRAGLDMDNAIDISLFFNLIQGHDNVRGPAIKNMYIAIRKEHDRLRALYCPWDMDITWGNLWTEDVEVNKVIPYGMPADYNCVMESGYLGQLLDNGDEAAWKGLFEKYRHLRGTGWSDENINAMLDEYEADIYGSGAYLRDQERWPEGTYGDAAAGLDHFRAYVMERLQETDRYYERLEALQGENVLVRRSAQYKDFEASQFVLEINDRELLADPDYEGLLEYVGIDISKVTGEVRFVFADPATGRFEYLATADGLPYADAIDAPGSEEVEIRMLILKDGAVREFDFY